MPLRDSLMKTKFHAQERGGEEKDPSKTSPLAFQMRAIIN